MKRFSYAFMLCKALTIVHFVEALPSVFLDSPRDSQENRQNVNKPKFRMGHHSGDVFILNSEPLHVKIPSAKINENSQNNKFPRGIKHIYEEIPASNMYYNMMTYIDDPIDRMEQYLNGEQKMVTEKQNSLLDDLPAIDNTRDQFKKLKRVKRKYIDGEILEAKTMIIPTTKPQDGNVNSENTLTYEDENGFVATVEEMIAMIDEQLKNKTQAILKRIARQNDFPKLRETDKAAIKTTVIGPTLSTIRAEHTNETATIKSPELSSTRASILTSDPHEIYNVSEGKEVDGSDTTDLSLLEKRNIPPDHSEQKIIRHEQSEFNTTDNYNQTLTIDLELNNTKILETLEFEETTRKHTVDDKNKSLEHFETNKTGALYQLDSNETSLITLLEVNETTKIYQKGSNKTSNQTTTTHQFNPNKAVTTNTLETNNSTSSYELNSNVTTMSNQFELNKTAFLNQSRLNDATTGMTHREKDMKLDKVILHKTMHVDLVNHEIENSTSNNSISNKTSPPTEIEINKIKTKINTSEHYNHFNLNNQITSNHFKPSPKYNYRPLNFTGYHIQNKTKFLKPHQYNVVTNFIEANVRSHDHQFEAKKISTLHTMNNKTESSAKKTFHVEYNEYIDSNDDFYEANTRNIEDVFRMAVESEVKMMRSNQNYHPITFKSEDTLQSHTSHQSIALASFLNVMLVSLLIYGVLKIRRTQILSHVRQSFRRRPHIRRPNCPFVNIPLHAYTAQTNEPVREHTTGAL